MSFNENFTLDTATLFNLQKNKSYLKHFICACVLLLTVKLCAQEQNSLSGFGIEANQLAGKVLKHSPKFILPIPELSTAFDINFVWQTYGKKEWHQRRHFPMIGFGLTYTDYGIEPIYGRCIGAYTNLQLTLFRSKSFEWTLRLGDGIAYVSKKYQTTTPIDTLNTAIGSHINDFGIFLTDLRYHVNNHWDLQLGANFTHISNADYHNPNLGINMYGTHIGFRYFPATSKPHHIVKELPKLENRYLTHIQLGIAFNEARTTGNPEVPTYTASIYESRRWLSKNNFYAGVNYAYKESTYEFLKHYGVDYGHEAANSWDGAFFAGNEFLIGSVGIISEVGLYYKQTYLKFVPVYEKIGGNLYLINKETGSIKQLYITARLLTHGIVAEYAEFGIGTAF